MVDVVDVADVADADVADVVVNNRRITLLTSNY